MKSVLAGVYFVTRCWYWLQEFHARWTTGKIKKRFSIAWTLVTWKNTYLYFEKSLWHPSLLGLAVPGLLEVPVDLEVPLVLFHPFLVLQQHQDYLCHPSVQGDPGVQSCLAGQQDRGPQWLPVDQDLRAHRVDPQVQVDQLDLVLLELLQYQPVQVHQVDPEFNKKYINTINTL